jgi:predicted nicotinamide N-methyase
MDIRTLPEPERTRYNRLRKRYSLHFESLRVGELQIRLLKPSDLDELLDGQKPLDQVGTFPFWFRLWEASLVLGHVLARDPAARGGRLLDLGAGLGLAGLAAGKAGFAVTLSDSEQVISEFQQVSIAANQLENVTSLVFDLDNVPDIGPFDVISGAEVLFREEFVEPMLNICQNYLKPGGTIYLAHDVRRRSLSLFLRRSESFFTIGSRKQTVSRPGGRATDILVNRLQPLPASHP